MHDSWHSDGHWNQGGLKSYSEEDIDAAIAAGALSEEAARKLKEHVLASASAPAADEEYFRLIGGFNDFFVVIACGLLLVAICWLGNTIYVSLGPLCAAGAAWPLAEYFIRKKRLALTAIMLLLSFAAGIFFCVFLLPLLHDTSWGIIAASLATCIGVWLHWRRFHVPITVACGTGSLVSLCITFIIKLVPVVQSWLHPLFFCSGVLVLALAIYRDSSDTKRQTRRSDVAFWLHILAAPLLVHPIFSFLGVFKGETSLTLACGAIALYIGIGFVSLVLDRRALMVSSLVYVLSAFAVLFKEYGAVGSEVAVAALVIGGSLLLLSATWQRMRYMAMRLFPPSCSRYFPAVQG